VSGAGLPVLNATRAEHGLAPLSAWADQLRRVHAFYMMTAPELDFSSRGALPPNVHYVGPAFEPVAGEWHPPWPDNDTAPLILISFSTTYMDQHALAQRVLDAVADLPVRALLTTGPALDGTRLRIPANVRVERYVPHRAVLPHAALVITHAGWQTISVALAAGVPLVCLPDARDQPDNAARVVEVGAGVKVRKGTSPKRLRAVVAKALDDRQLADAAQEMSQALGKHDGGQAIADSIERLSRQRLNTGDARETDRIQEG
jgi:MGT family glycosyltransferase